MLAKAAVVISFVSLALAVNVPPPIGQGAVPSALVPPPLGPVLSVFGRLSPQKQKEYRRIIENDTTLTKKELKEKQKEFAKGLSENIQKAIAEAKADYDQKEAEVLAASKKLTAAAQEFVVKIKALLDDDRITRSAQNVQLQSLHENAQKEVQDELRNANIPFPFGPPPGIGGSLILN